MPVTVFRQRSAGSPQAIAALTAALGTPLLAGIAASRGASTADDVDIAPRRLRSPADVPGCVAAAELLADHVQRDAHIVVAGDYDADGATATALVVEALNLFGAHHVHYLIPDRRRDGYGLKVPLVARATEQGAALLLTVDNGISSVDGVAAARAAGIDVIVTDHHLPPAQLPAANAIVNPALDDAPLLALAGVGVAFYLMLQLRSVLRARGAFSVGGEPTLSGLLDLVALGTVADVVPFDHNNRVLVSAGIARMQRGQMRPGLAALVASTRLRVHDIDERALAFTLAPRLNAVGRLEQMDLGVALLLATDVEAARPIAERLVAVNADRRALDVGMTAQALALAAAQPQRRALVLAAPGWNSGVVGIVAARVREQLARPVFAFADSGNDLLQGSGRSLPGVHLRDVLAAVDARFPGLMRQFGGHAMAAGVTLAAPRLGRFAQALETVLAQLFPDGMPGVVVETDGGLDAGLLTLETAIALAGLGPFGPRFPVPEFCDSFDVIHERRYGGAFSRLVVRRDGRLFDAIARLPAVLGPGSHRLVYRLSINRQRAAATLELEIVHHVHGAVGQS